MSQTPAIMEKAIVNGGKITSGVIYEGLRSFFDRLIDRSSASEAPSWASCKEFESTLMSLADHLLFRALDLGLESTRSKRAQAVLSFTRVCEQAKVPVADSQRRIVGEWLAAERSGPVQAILRQVLGKF